MRIPLLAAAPQLATLGWLVALIANHDPLEGVPAVLVGAGLAMMSTVATVGMIVVQGRWAHRYALITMGLTAILALSRPIDLFWVIAVVLSTVALIALSSPTLTASIRKLPSASGPPPRVVAAPLLLLAVPCVLGMVGNGANDGALLVVALSAPVAAFMYSRVLPGGLIAIRIGWPIVALGLSPLLGPLAGSLAAAIAIVLIVVARDPLVKASFHPPQEVGTILPIPPELAPREVLDAAEIDEGGLSK